MNSLLLTLSLSVLAAPANDNNTLDAPVCVACAAHGASVDNLCDDCDGDLREHLSLYNDPEVEALARGLDTDPRF